MSNKQFVAVSNIGKRSNNEDYYYVPNTSDTANNLYIVCDGVGGGAMGEIASSTVCNTIANYYNDHQHNFNMQQAVDEAVAALKKIVAQQPDYASMATTLTVAYFNNNGVTIGHIGDSRVYILCNGQITYQTKDHSLVNEMVAAGFITETEALTHPKRNVITRALNASTEKIYIDEIFFPELKDNDFIFLCTDGILESLTDKDVANLSSNELNLEEKEKSILEQCLQNSNDNFTCVLIQYKATPVLENELPINNTALIATSNKQENLELVTNLETDNNSSTSIISNQKIEPITNTNNHVAKESNATETATNNNTNIKKGKLPLVVLLLSILLLVGAFVIYNLLKNKTANNESAELEKPTVSTTKPNAEIRNNQQLDVPNNTKPQVNNTTNNENTSTITERTEQNNANASSENSKDKKPVIDNNVTKEKKYDIRKIEEAINSQLKAKKSEFEKLKIVSDTTTNTIEKSTLVKKIKNLDTEIGNLNRWLGDIITKQEAPKKYKTTEFEIKQK